MRYRENFESYPLFFKGYKKFIALIAVGFVLYEIAFMFMYFYDWNSITIGIIVIP